MLHIELKRSIDQVTLAITFILALLFIWLYFTAQKLQKANRKRRNTILERWRQPPDNPKNESPPDN